MFLPSERVRELSLPALVSAWLFVAMIPLFGGYAVALIPLIIAFCARRP